MGRAINTCVRGNCEDCEINTKTNCTFQVSQLVQFYVISLPSFLLGGIGLYRYSNSVFFFWIVIICLFFFIIEPRILCSHCPHYEKSHYVLQCWANSGIPKLWKFRPEPMSFVEKAILIAGFVLVWGYPLPFFLLSHQWWFLVLYTFFAILFFTLLIRRNCVRCINISCPLNRVDGNTKELFLRNNPTLCRGMSRADTPSEK